MVGKFDRWFALARRVTWRAYWTAVRVVRRPTETRMLLPVEASSTSTHTFVRCVEEPAYIEPEWGYLIREHGGLVEDSLELNFERGKALWRIGVVSPVDLWKAQHGRLPVREFESVVTLRNFYEWNYYHFHLDVLGELALLDEAGVDPHIPIVLGAYASQLTFPRQVIGMGHLADRTWIVQDGFFIRASRIYYAQTRRQHLARVDPLLDLMDVPAEGPTKEARVFLTRNPPNNRVILNRESAEEVMKSYGFDVVDTANMPVEEQIKLFLNTRYLVAIHGAGVVNIIYRRHRPLGLLEIHSDRHWGGDFESICHQFGYFHDALACRADDNPVGGSASMWVDPDELAAKLERLIELG